MSIESKIEALTNAINGLVACLQSTTVSVAAAQVPATMNASATVPVMPVAQVPVAATPAFAAPTVPTMPAPPSFITPVAPSPAAVPFSDSKTLVDYVMAKYKVLGPEKGALIQNVLVSLGYDNINNVKPEHYAALYQGVESLGA